MKKALFFLFTILLFAYSCNKTNKSFTEEQEDLGLNANKSVPKDIVITKNLIQVTDSSFTFKDKEKILSSASVRKFDKGFLKSDSFKHYQDEVLTSLLESECDEYGRYIKSTTSYPIKEDVQIMIQSYDKYGNISKREIFKNSTTIPTTNNRFTYQYENGNIIKQISFSENLNRFFSEIHYTYDKRGNRILEISSNNNKITSIYDNDNNLIENINLDTDNNSIVTHTKYIYKDGLLVKVINEKGKYYFEQSEDVYEYNENRQLIKHYYSSVVIKYLNYDDFGNWTKREYYSNNDLQDITLRAIIYK